MPTVWTTAHLVAGQRVMHLLFNLFKFDPGQLVKARLTATGIAHSMVAFDYSGQGPYQASLSGSI